VIARRGMGGIGSARAVRPADGGIAELDAWRYCIRRKRLISPCQSNPRKSHAIHTDRAAGSFSLLVLPEHLASRFKDVSLPPVLATPVMIMAMENAALNAIKPYLDAGESALGTRVDVRHLARRRRANRRRRSDSDPR